MYGVHSLARSAHGFNAPHVTLSIVESEEEVSIDHRLADPTIFLIRFIRTCEYML